METDIFSSIDVDFWLSVGAVFFLLCLSAFFSGSETALTAASRARMHNLERDGDEREVDRAIIVLKLLEIKDRLIGALLLGNNLVNIMASALATSVLIKMFGDAGVVYATLVMTILVLIFAEVLPKTYAINNADKMSLTIAPVVKVLVAVLSPITGFIIKIVQKTMQLFGVDVNATNVGHHELLRGVIEMHKGEDEETNEERAMLKSILDLPDVAVEDVMVHRKDVLMIDADQPAADVIAQVLDSPFTRLPLWRETI